MVAVRIHCRAQRFRSMFLSRGPGLILLGRIGWSGEKQMPIYSAYFQFTFGSSPMGVVHLPFSVLARLFFGYNLPTDSLEQ